MSRNPKVPRSQTVRRKRHPNYRRVKINRNYTIGEIAALLGVHKGTVRQWIKAGLPTCHETRPLLILGPDLRQFLRARRAKNKRPCQPGEIYCVRCRAPKRPDGQMAEYQCVTDKIGNLMGICPDCYCIINRRVSLARLEQIRADL